MSITPEGLAQAMSEAFEAGYHAGAYSVTRGKWGEGPSPEEVSEAYVEWTRECDEDSRNESERE